MGPSEPILPGESQSGRESGFQGTHGGPGGVKAAALTAQAGLLQGRVGADIKEGSALPARSAQAQGGRGTGAESRLQLQKLCVLDFPQLLQFPELEPSFTEK